MPPLERRVNHRGPRFYFGLNEDGEEIILFVQHLDSSSSIGPREATDEDREAFPEAYAAMSTDETERPDGPGRPLLTIKDPHVKPPKPPTPYADKREAARERGEA